MYVGCLHPIFPLTYLGKMGALITPSLRLTKNIQEKKNLPVQIEFKWKKTVIYVHYFYNPIGGQLCTAF